MSAVSLFEGTPCERWASLSDRISIGDSVDFDDMTFLRKHASVCDACGEEARLYAELGGLLAPNDAHEEEEPRRSEVVPRIHAPTPEAARNIPSRTRIGAGIAALAMAAGIALYAWSRMHAPEGVNTSPNAPLAVTPPPAVSAGSALSVSPSTAPALAKVALLEGDVTVDAVASNAGATLAPGSVLATGRGRACVLVEPGIRVCLAPSSTLRMESLDGPARVLRLVRGRVAAELLPQPAGTSFSIAAADGSVTAVGTAFSVELVDGAPVVARVSHGVVLVREDKATSHLVRAHEVNRFGEGVRALPTPDEDQDRALLRSGGSASTDAEKPARLTLLSTPVGAAVQLDGATIGTTPLDLLVSPGDHVLTAPGLTATTLHVASSEHLEKSWVTSAVIAPNAPTSSAPVLAPHEPQNNWPVAAPTPSAMLADARAARARGDSGAAAQAYRSLLASHPNSPEATAATLSLAELELGRGANADALALYDRYITSKGPLLLEARYGKVRALGALGRTADARAEAASFVRDYPDSPQADALRSHGP